MKKYIIALLFLACLSCGDDDVANLPEVQLLEITNITNTTATSNSEVTSELDVAITERGICWNTSPNPTINNSTTSNGNGLGAFTSTLNSLSVNTAYYARSFAKNSDGITYSNTLEFNTNLPEVITGAIINVTPIGITVKGEVTNEGGSSVTLRGLCWSTTSNPTIEDNQVLNGTGLGAYTTTINEFSAGNVYYVRSFARNSIGVAYGNQIVYTSYMCDNGITTDAIINLSSQQEVDAFNYNIVGGLKIEGNNITDLSPLLCLEQISDANDFGLSIINNPALISLHGLNNLQEVYGVIKIDDNSSLINTYGLSGLTSTALSYGDQADIVYNGDASFIIENNSSLQNISAPNFSGQVGMVRINNNPNLVSVNLSSATEFLGLRLSNCPQLVNLNLESLTTIGYSWVSQIPSGVLEINNTGLTDLSLFSNSVGGLLAVLQIHNNASLRSLSGFENTSFSMGWLVSIVNNDVLININQLINLGLHVVPPHYEPGIRIIFSDNDALVNISGIASVISKVHEITISNNNNLTNLNGLNSTSSCTYGEPYYNGLHIENNNSLIDFCSITNLAINASTLSYCGGPFVISGNAYNPTLQDIVNGNCSQ